MFSHSFLCLFFLVSILECVYCTSKHHPHDIKAKSAAKAGGVAKPETPQYVLPPHATSSDTNLKKIIELVDIVNENVKLPFKGVTNFTVSFIDDGGQTVHSAAFKKAMHKTKTNDLAAFETVKNSWDKMLQTNSNIAADIEAEITHKKAKKEEADKLNTVVHVWSKIMSQAQGHLKATYSPKQKALELHWAKQLIGHLITAIGDFKYSHNIENQPLKELAKETAALNTIHQHFAKSFTELEKLKKGIEELLASKDEKKFAKLADVKDLKIEEFFGEDLSFAHEQNPQAANSKHGEAEEDAGGDHKLGHAENHDVEEPQQSGNLEGAAEPSDIPEE